ncbi:MAG: hypothetical protein B6D59_05220 [Campylobacteraceae bacterium 4484_4]|nr:MAG: hypothetical protein B6D59_05220 [Campylobacteraceae bacterium 4484_4]
MTITRRIKVWFLSFFREIFLYHHSSLEFRAKLLALMIGANRQIEACEKEILQQIAQEIYPDDQARVDVLVSTTKEYVKKIIENNELDLNELILNVDKELSQVKRFVKKIDIGQLKRFLRCSERDEETQLIQQRILDFLENEIREYGNETA